ncbi:MAG: hypothetical protein QNJ44_02795 [Rhodobacter sp.]|nr:hypothetical protein [Rhodobacter sp.]
MTLPRLKLNFRPARAVPDALTVRETAWGYVIRSVRPDDGLQRPVERLAACAVWLAAAGFWLIPAGWLPEPAFAARALASVALPVAFYTALALRSRTSGYEVEVDTMRRELRMGEVSAEGRVQIRSRARFDQVRDCVWRRSGGANAVRDLCLRLKDGGDPLPVAVGDEGALFAVHARLMRDLRPMEERVSSYQLGTGRGPARRVFPALGPQELPA